MPKILKDIFSKSMQFYSPIVDVDEVLNRKNSVFSSDPSLHGINYNFPEQLEIFKKIFSNQYSKYPYLKSIPANYLYSEKNSEFSWLDSKFLFCWLMEYQPKNIIEIGSGHSSQLMSDVNTYFLSQKMNIRLIEPFRSDSVRGLPGISDLKVDKVQDVPISYFKSLSEGDLLFIDSSHVVKTGSDCEYIYFEVLPVLESGVYVHIHDIFLPYQYPIEWIQQGFSWNEQYLLKALLMDSKRYRPVFGCNSFAKMFPNELADSLMTNLHQAYGGSSFYIRIA